MTNTMQFDLASPQKLVFTKPVAMVTVPGEEGMFGVLPGHASMNACVAMGVVSVYETDPTTVSERFFVVGGFCEVTPTTCSVMVDDVVPFASLNREEIEAEIKELKAEEKSDDAAFKLAVAQAKLQAVTYL